MSSKSSELKKPNRFLQSIGAVSWNDAALCVLVYTFLILFIISFFYVVGTFVASFFSGLFVKSS